MRSILLTFCMVAFCSQGAQAIETQTVKTGSEELPVELVDPQTMGRTPTQKFVINVTWKDYIDDNVTTNLNGIEPAAGKSIRSDGSIEDGFTVSLSNQVVTSPTPPKFELSYTTTKNISLRTKHSGLMLYKKFKFEPEVVHDNMPETGFDIGQPQFTQ